jgi:hypothetical protein
MADSAAFEPAQRSSDHVVAAVRANERPACSPASRSGPAGGLRPSRVPVPSVTTALGGFPSRAGEPARRGLQALRAGGASAGAARVPARPSAVSARPVPGLLPGSGQPLAGPVKEEMEARLGADFSRVRVHAGGAARASAAGLGARAYTVGSHVVIGEGGEGRHVLAHELTHVIQQRQGPVAGTDYGNGLKISHPSDRDEQAAEANAVAVMRAPLRQDRLTAAVTGEQRTAAVRPAAGTEAGVLKAGDPVGRTASIQRVGGDDPAIIYGTIYGANPRLYKDTTSSPHRFLVSSEEPAVSGDWVPVEQFCAYMAAYWLTHDPGRAGLIFKRLPEEDKVDAVTTLDGWATTGGADAQVTYAAGQLGGSSVTKDEVVRSVPSIKTYPRGTRIWFANDEHVEAAVVGRDKSYLVYDPNTGKVEANNPGGFLKYIKANGANTFVVAVPAATDAQGAVGKFGKIKTK